MPYALSVGGNLRGVDFLRLGRAGGSSSSVSKMERGWYSEGAKEGFKEDSFWETKYNDVLNLYNHYIHFYINFQLHYIYVFLKMVCSHN